MKLFNSIIIAFSLLMTPTMPLMAQQTWGTQQSWEVKAMAYANQNPDNDGLMALATGLSKIQTSGTNSKEMKEIINSGWKKDYTQTLNAINANQAALQSIYLAGSKPETKLPPVTTPKHTASVPNFMLSIMAIDLTLCNARLLEAKGELNQAVDLALHAAWITSFYTDENQMLITHLIGCKGQDKALIVLQSLLKNPNLDQATIMETGSQLYKIEKRRKSFYNCLEIEGAEKEFHIRNAFNNESNNYDNLQGLISNLDLESTVAEHKQLLKLILENEKKGFWERDIIDDNWLKAHTNNPLLILVEPKQSEGLVRDELALARLRICQAICAIRLGKEETASSFKDPFSGKPLLQNGEIVYSIGPDMKDQEGKVIYNPKNGTYSEGDVGVTP